MPTYRYAREVPPRSQFDPSSGSLFWSQVYNCGVVVATQIAQFFYNLSWLGIETTRTMAAIPRGRSTTYDEQRRMMGVRKVGATVRVISSIAELRSLVAGGTRPVSIGVLQSRVPAAVRGHSFLGWHSWDIVDAPTGGFWYNESNLPVDSTKKRRFITDAQLKYAFIDEPGSAVAVVPYDRKETTAPPPRPHIQMNQDIYFVNLRSGPGLNYSIIGSARGKGFTKKPGIYRGAVIATAQYFAPLESTFIYIGSDATGDWRKMEDGLKRPYWVKREYTHVMGITT